MRITVTVKGEIEEYIKNQMDMMGMTAGTVAAYLIMNGVQWSKSVEALSKLTQLKGGIDGEPAGS